MIVTKKRILKYDNCQVTEIVDAISTDEQTAFDNRLQCYWIERKYAAYGEREVATEMFCFWSKGEVSRAMKELLKNILTLALTVWNESKTVKVRYYLEWDISIMAIREEILQIMEKNKVKQHSIAAKDAPRIGQEAIHQAQFTRKLQKAIKALEQDIGEIQFAVDTTNYGVTLKDGEYVITRNGKLYDIWAKGRRAYV